MTDQTHTPKQETISADDAWLETRKAIRVLATVCATQAFNIDEYHLAKHRFEDIARVAMYTYHYLGGLRGDSQESVSMHILWAQSVCVAVNLMALAIVEAKEIEAAKDRGDPVETVVGPHTTEKSVETAMAIMTVSALEQMQSDRKTTLIIDESQLSYGVRHDV